jgi:DNA-directed RNA polymerase specialized sigma24 family protein
MARNKLVSQGRRQHRHKRDVRLTVAGDDLLNKVQDDSPSPSEMAVGKELWQRFQAGLSDEERQLVELRGQGLAWAEVADRLGGTAQGRRMQLARALDRVSETLGLDEASDE